MHAVFFLFAFACTGWAVERLPRLLAAACVTLHFAQFDTVSSLYTPGAERIALTEGFVQPNFLALSL